MKNTIKDGSPRAKVEEYVQYHCFKEWTKNHKDAKELGVFGLLGRANATLPLCDKGAKGDDIPNMATAEGIVAKHPLPVAPAPPPRGRASSRGRGRPSRRRGRRGSRGMASKETQIVSETIGSVSTSNYVASEKNRVHEI